VQIGRIRIAYKKATNVIAADKKSREGEKKQPTIDKSVSIALLA